MEEKAQRSERVYRGKERRFALEVLRCGGSVAGDKTKRCPALSPYSSLTFRGLGVFALLPSFNIAIKKR